MATLLKREVQRIFIGRAAIQAASSVALLLPIVGCGLNGGSNLSAPAPISSPLLKASGGVHGGQQVVSGATLQLYAAGAPATAIGGYGQGAVALIPAGSYFAGGLPGCVAINGVTCTTLPTTDATGSFNLTTDYSCTPGSLVYAVATGGNSGTGVNPNLALMAILGTCPSTRSLATTVPYIFMDEVTTVSAVWALQQFMAAPTTGNKLAPAIGAPGTFYSNGLTTGALSVQSGIIGLTNAFGMARLLADVSTGSTPNLNFAYATPESAKINTIADILAYCINSSGGVSGDGTPCGNLFQVATPATLPSGAAAAADTIQAAWYMAQNPTLNVSTLFAFTSSAPPFVGLSAAPTDLTIGVNFAPTTSGATPTFAVAASQGIGIDAYGNVWVSNVGGITSNVVSTVTEPAASIAELSPLGQVITAPVTTFTVSSTGGAAPQFTGALPSTARTITNPRTVAIDLTNNAWMSNYGDTTATGMTGTTATTAGTVGVFNGSTGAGVAGSGSTGYFVGTQPWGVAIDQVNNVYTASVGATGTADVDGRSITRMAAVDGSNFSYSNSTIAAQTPQGSLQSGPTATTGTQAILALDNNTAGGGSGFLWALNGGTCKTFVPSYPSAANNNNTGQWLGASNTGSTAYGLINQLVYSPSVAPTPTNGSLKATSVSGATIGTGTATNLDCATTETIGDVFTAPMASPNGIAVDRNNGVWITNQFTSTTGFDGLTYLAAPTSVSGVVPSSTYLVSGTLPTLTTSGVGGTIMGKAANAYVDGNNNVWAVNTGKSSFAEAGISNGVASFLTPATAGFTHTMGSAAGIAIDPSGNVWDTNSALTGVYTAANGTTPITGNSLTVIIGAAGPVVTPLSLSLKSNRLGQKP